MEIQIGIRIYEIFQTRGNSRTKLFCSRKRYSNYKSIFFFYEINNLACDVVGFLFPNHKV